MGGGAQPTDAQSVLEVDVDGEPAAPSVDAALPGRESSPAQPAW
jgi:hypothetical protein